MPPLKCNPSSKNLGLSAYSPACVYCVFVCVCTCVYVWSVSLLVVRWDLNCVIFIYLKNWDLMMNIFSVLIIHLHVFFSLSEISIWTHSFYYWITTSFCPFLASLPPSLPPSLPWAGFQDCIKRKSGVPVVSCFLTGTCGSPSHLSLLLCLPCHDGQYPLEPSSLKLPLSLSHQWESS